MTTKDRTDGPIPPFDGFPYMVTLVVKSLYHISVLPKDTELHVLIDITRSQVRANKLQSCLALESANAVYMRVDGSEKWSTTVPYGALVVTGDLRTATEFPETEELVARKERLRDVIRRHHKPVILYGDLTKGGRSATLEERALLDGRQANGVPRGLAICPVCRRWRGQCLDPSPEFDGQLMRVDCLCANDNLCARCMVPLAEYKLNSNFYDEDRNEIWHLPAFSAMSHRCSDLQPSAGGPDGGPTGPNPADC